jgi:predicted phosphodiesterase
MKILLISDLHANIDALNAVWAKEKEADVVLCVGDIVDWGWNPHEVIAWLKEKNAVCICGNHDLETLKLYDSGVREELGMETTYASHCVNQLTEEDVAFLRALPEVRVLKYDGVTYCMKHSLVMHERKSSVQILLGEYRALPAFREKWNELVTPEEDADASTRCLILGHSHIPFLLRAMGEEYYLNPGSTHYRKGPDSVAKGADYVIIQDGTPIFRHVDYPTAHLRARIEASNFPQNIKTPALVYAGSHVD